MLTAHDFYLLTASSAVGGVITCITFHFIIQVLVATAKNSGKDEE